MKAIQTKSYLTILIVLFSITAYGQDIEKSVLVTANIGNTENSIVPELITASKQLNDPTLIILGNFVSKDGFHSKNEAKVLNDLNLLKEFNGKVIILPGHNEWAHNGYKSVKDLEKFIQKNSDAKFYPDEGCPIKKKDITDNLVMVSIDSQWFLEDWNDHTYINEDCAIKNRTQFFLEFESILKKSQGKTIMVAMHHPIFSNTKEGLLKRVGGFSKGDFQHKQYQKLRNRIITLSRQAENIFFISGHDKNLQYINNYQIPQIISGSQGKTKKAKAINNDDFASDAQGYAKLDIYDNGEVMVNFIENEATSFSKELFKKNEKNTSFNIKPKSSYSDYTESSIYSPDETKKSKVYRGLWGDHYREFYSKPITAKVAFIDTLNGGLTPIRRGGGHQSKSLRLEDSSGKEYVMRALRKSAIKFLQSTAFQDTYVEEDLEDSFIESFVLDFYTTAHPYTPTTIGELSDAVEVFHTNPNLYYIPKQDALGEYNDEYGDELYIIEERVESGHNDLESFGMPDDIISTNDVLKEVHKTGKSQVDEPSYIRARLFDMLIGDWDRHEDQWRWALFKQSDGTQIYKPIPRDRDQAFSIFDGTILGFLRCAVPNLRMMQSFDEELPSPKWFSFEPYPLDMTFINHSNWSDWENQVKQIQEGLTDDVIERAFENVPSEVKGQTIEDIKTKLKGRRSNLKSIARDYYDYLNKHEVITGTQKDDIFTITRLPDGKTTIKIQRKDIGVFERTFNKEETKEIWIYGLDGKDTFNVIGDGNNNIKLRVLGGKKNDTYNFENTKAVKLYDYKGKDNTITNNKSKKWLVDDYQINNYDYKKRKYSLNQLLPNLGFNPDDGVQIGLVDVITTYGIQRNPFTTKHTIGASYYTGNSGYNLFYKGEFSNIFHNWNFGIEGKYTSPNFAQNFFGIGNETEYDKDVVDLDFNRVSIREWSAAISLIWRGLNGGSFYIKPYIESFDVENKSDRFISNLPSNTSFFQRQNYLGTEVNYSYSNKDNAAFPTLGFETNITAGYKKNIDEQDFDNNFAYLFPNVAINHKLNKSGSFVFATRIGAELIFGDNFEFYHGATLGGIKNLRGFRKERFIGKYALYQNTDLRLKLGKFKTSFIPLNYGITGGFDYGRVWVENDTSDKWHPSVGGNFWITGLDSFSTSLGYFASSDGGLITFSFGFQF